MKPIVRLLVLLGAIIASQAASGQSNDLTERLINPWYYCVGQATGRQSDRSRHPEEAVERAFLACQTEEMAIRSYAELAYIPQAQINGIIAMHRGKLKKSLVDNLTKK